MRKVRGRPQSAPPAFILRWIKDYIGSVEILTRRCKFTLGGHRPAGKLETMGAHNQTRYHALYLAARDPRVLVRKLAISVAAYALSLIDLIADFVPVLGYLEDSDAPSVVTNVRYWHKADISPLADYFAAYTMQWLSRINCGYLDLPLVAHHLERHVGPRSAQP